MTQLPRDPSALRAFPPAAAAAPPLAAAPPAAASPPVASGDAVPEVLRRQLSELEEWALANKAEARSDAIAFWSLKVPAILAAAGAGVMAQFTLTTVGVIAGAVASVCVIIDGVHPRGMLRNVHLRAYHDLRILSSNMMSQWRSRKSGGDEEEAARQIIRDAEEQRQSIAKYIRDAETALEFKSKT